MDGERPIAHIRLMPPVQIVRRAQRVAAALLLALPTGARAQTPNRAALLASLDSIITTEMAARKWPSVAVMLVRGRDTVLNKAYGKADLELDTPARVDGIYWIGSVTKQFVAAEILKLAERGALSLDDSIGKWVSDLPAWWRPVGLRELLWHTSGIASYTGQPRAPAALIRAGNPVDSTLALVRDVPPDFPRGSNMLYNNTGYILLGRVIEIATAKSLGAALTDDLFTPLGLSHMSYCNLTALVPGRVGGYARVGTTVQRALLWWPHMAGGAGALCGTVGDLVAWSQALHGGRVLSPSSYATMTAAGVLADGTPLRYGMGLLRTEVAGRRAYQHTGGIAGFTTWLAYLPDDSVHVAMTLNLLAGSERPSLAGVKVVERLLGARAQPAPVVLSATTRRSLVGTYGEAPRQAIALEDSTGALRLAALGAPPTALVYRGADGATERFTIGDGTLVRFERPRAGQPPARVRLDGGTMLLTMDRKP